jgi:hypothetical protein
MASADEAKELGECQQRVQHISDNISVHIVQAQEWETEVSSSTAITFNGGGLYPCSNWAEFALLGNTIMISVYLFSCMNRHRFYM